MNKRIKLLNETAEKFTTDYCANNPTAASITISELIKIIKQLDKFISNLENK